MKNLTIFGEEIIDHNSVAQIKNCISDEDIAVLTADAHYGYGHPIGGVVAYKNKISLSGVGFDIACGNKAVKTNVLASDIPVARVMDEIYRRISFGAGRPNNEPADHEILERIYNAAFGPQRNLAALASSQLGTVGGGNHYVDLFEGEDGYLWIGVHFGSRGFGHKTAMGFIAMSQGLGFADRGRERGMDKPPILFPADSDIGQAYLSAMHLAGDYAYAGRDMVVNKVLDILDHPQVLTEVHNHHNFAWKEQHFGSDYWVVRKGCTPAFPGQQGFIGSNMMDTSVIVEGPNTELAKSSLYSTVHGAGRVMSRTQAAGKKKWQRDADGIRKSVPVSRGLVDFEEVKEEMRKKNIELRGAGADEAPACYKKLDDVLGYMGNTVKVLHRLTPIGVAMAGNDTFDPYKD